MTETGLWQMLQPMQKVAHLLGCNPYVHTEQNRLYLSIPRLIYCLFCLTFVVIYMIVNADDYSSIPINQEFAKASTITDLILIKLVGNAINMILSFLLFFKSIKLYEQIFEDFKNVDTVLAELGQQKQLSKANNHVRKWFFIIAIITECILDLIVDILFQIFFKFHSSYMDTLIFLYPSIILDNTQIAFFTLLLMYEERFKILNELFTNISEESQTKHKYPVDSEEFCKIIKKYVSLHKDLVRGSKRVNERYSFQILLIITMAFVLLIGNLYSAMSIILLKLFPTHYATFVRLIKNCILCLGGLYYSSKRCMDLCEQANSSKNILLGVKISIDMEDARNTVIVSTLKLMQNKLEITACKLFAIDNALLFSICAAASSYLFIMLQLDMSNSGESNNVLNEPSD